METLLQERTPAGVLILTLNRPDTLNGINEELRQALIAAFRQTKNDDSVRAIILTGAGRAFCAGVDLSGGGPAHAEGGAPTGRSAIVDKRGRPYDVITSIADADVPVIVAINGVAAGAGFSLALASDIRIASDQARLGSIFIKRGIGADYGSSYWLPRLVGVARAFEVLYAGDPIPAARALELGLLNRVVPHDTLLDEAIAYATMIAEGPPIAYTYTRRAIHRSFENTLERQLEFEWTLQTELLNTADAREGFRSFAERRKPRFTGA